MKKGKDYGLLIASMVAIVAIVGLVIMFSGGATGAFERFPTKGPECWMAEGGIVCDGEYIEPSGFGPSKPTGKLDPSTEQKNRPFESKPGYRYGYEIGESPAVN